MTEFSPRFRGPSLPKLNLLPASHFLQQQQPPQQQPVQQHPFDASDEHDHKDMEMDMSLTFESSPLVDTQTNHQSKTFVSAHPSPEVSDESDSERTLPTALHHNESPGVSRSPTQAQRSSLDQQRQQDKRRLAEHRREQIQNEHSLSHHILLAPIPVPKSTRTPPHSPLYASSSSLGAGHRASFSSLMQTPPGSASTVPSMPCSDPILVEALIRREVRPERISSHATERAYFWPLGKLSEFSFSDRFVRSRIFEINDNNPALVVADTNKTTKDIGISNLSTAKEGEQDNESSGSHMALSMSANTDPTVEAAAAIIVANTRQGTTISATAASHDIGSASTSASAATPGPGKSSWRLRLYPHGRGDRHRDSEFIGLYLQQEGGAGAAAAAMNRRSSGVADLSAIPSPTHSRGSISSRRSISSSSGLPVVRRHVTLFIATENGDCLAKQDLVQWFSGGEGGLGFPRMISRKAVQEAVRAIHWNDDDEEEEEREIGIVAGVIFHEL
ncbi:hypothetical protein BGZ83_009705 [Gryganskiella cystojenkinii]|nr:hypothetical protein BGZ83_009705 [Gryganskiella cystojenkinii]